MATKMELTEYEFPDEAEAKSATQTEQKVNKAAADDSEFDLEIVDDTPPQDRGRKAMAEPPEDVTEDELKSYDEKVQKRLKKFTKGYHDERRAKEEALRERQAAEEFAKQVFEENKRLQYQLSEGSKVFIEQGKSSAQLQLEQAKKKYKDAYENGDVDAVAEAQAEIAKAALRLDKAENLRPIEVQEKPEYSPAKSPTSSQGDPKLERWLSDNPWYGDESDDQHTIMSATALGVHNALVRQHGQNFVGSDEYYEKVNSRMRNTFPDYFRSQESQDDSEDEPQQAAPRAKPATVVAPATRSTSPKKVKLSASQVAIAKRLGVPLELYAKKVAEQQENR
jgi:hypothetical protein